MENLNEGRTEYRLHGKTGRDIRGKLEEKWLALVRLYTFNTPVAKGKYRLIQLALRLCKNVPKTVRSILKDGRQISIAISPGVSETVYFLGEYEKAISEIVTRLLERETFASMSARVLVGTRLCLESFVKKRARFMPSSRYPRFLTLFARTSS